MSGTTPAGDQDQGPCETRSCQRPYGHRGACLIRQCDYRYGPCVDGERAGDRCSNPTRNAEERRCLRHEDRATYERYDLAEAHRQKAERTAAADASLRRAGL